MEFLATKLAAGALLPPLNLLLLAFLGLLVSLFRRRIGLAISATSLIGLYMLCTPAVGVWLLGRLEPAAPAETHRIKAGQAIVILSGGTYFDAPEYGGDTVNAYTLERLRWGARLHRETGLPILVTGGNPRGNPSSEAAQMRATLKEDFRVETKWLEERSDNTFESAHYAREILAREGIDRIVLVTHASHMRRASLVFGRAGFTIIPAPTRFSTPDPASALNFLPNAYGLRLSSMFFHEAIGLGWYHVRLASGRDN